MWLTGFVFGCGLADNTYAILVEYVGQDLLGNKIIGCYLMYACSAIIFISFGIIAIWCDRRGRHKAIIVPLGEDLGLEFSELALVHRSSTAVKLARVEKGSIAE